MAVYKKIQKWRAIEQQRIRANPPSQPAQAEPIIKIEPGPIPEPKLEEVVQVQVEIKKVEVTIPKVVTEPIFKPVSKEMIQAVDKLGTVDELPEPDLTENNPPKKKKVIRKKK